MNKADLIDEIYRNTNLTKVDAASALDATLKAIVKAVAKKNDVQLTGFGSFKAHKRAARVGKNPRTGESIKIPAMTVPKFVAGTAFKDAVKKK